MKKHIKHLQSALETVIETASLSGLNRVHLPNAVLDFNAVVAHDDKPAYRALIETLDKIEGAPIALDRAKSICRRSLSWFSRREREEAQKQYEYSIEARAKLR